MIKSNISTSLNKTKRRTLTVAIAFFSFAIYLLFNIFKLDYVLYDYYKDRTFDQLTTTSVLRAERGNIYDTNMNPLAVTATSWRIFASPREIASRSKIDGIDYVATISSKLSEILSLDANSLKSKLSNSKLLDVTIEKTAKEEEYRSILDYINKNGLEDMIFTEAQSSRIYPESTLAAHVLGFTGSDNQGLYGLEYSYDTLLKGMDGYYLYAKDAGGKELPGGYSSYVTPTDGYSIVTTLDSYVQKTLEEIIEEIRITHNVSNRVTGIVMDTQTGAILAMATTSPFNPNNPFILDEQSMQKLRSSGYTEGTDEYKALKSELLSVMWSNKAVSEVYEPGSTFKIVTVSAALDSGAAKLSDTFSCAGYLSVGGWRIKCHKTKGHGSGFSLAYGLQMSCNPTMMQLAERIGAHRFYEYVKKFGYFEKTGIDLPSEAGTIFHDQDKIGTTELATASFGQRFKVSIISQLTAIAAVANGGKLIEPYLVRQIISSDGTVINQHQTVVKRQVISKDVAESVAKILADGVSGDGGAKNAYVAGYSVAAKTGTSEKFDILDENGKSYLRIGSTVAFAPSDENSIAAIIVVDEPQSQVKYGSVVAAPYISELFANILPYLDYESTTASQTVTVDSYVGMNISSAKNELEAKGLKYEIIGSGNVVFSQTPSSGIDLYQDTGTVYLYTEKTDNGKIRVPNLIGKTLYEANIIATNAGLNILIPNLPQEKSKRLTVSHQSISAGEYVKRGTLIQLWAIAMDFED